MDLLTSQKDEMYARTYGILGDLLDNRASIREDFVDLSTTLSRAFHGAMADSAEVWNRSRSSIVRWIPPEVLAHCALWLDFDDRVTASHICRHFRAVMLAAPTLWACVKITSSLSDDVGLHKVQSLLQRSAALPLEICFMRGASSSEIEACRPQFHRLRILELSEVLTPGALDCRMPRLLVFEISANAQQETPVEIPASWTGDGAPELRLLSLPAFSLPHVPQPFRNVTDFNATMKLCPDARRLFDYLPRIISLLLTDLAHDSLVPQGPVPISLERLVFAAVLGTAIDYSHHLEPYETRPIRRSFLVSSLNLAPALRTFTKTHERPWSMSIKTSLAEMSTHDETYNDDNVHCSVVLASVGTTCLDWPLVWDRTGPYFDRLVHLNISLTALVNLMWISPDMPDLEFLVIGVRDAVDAKEVETPSRTFPPNGVYLNAFALRAINMVVSFHEEEGDRPEIDRHCLRWFGVELPSLLRNCFDFHGPLERLSYIELGAGNPSPLPIDLQGLREFAREVLINGVEISGEEAGSKSTYEYWG